MSSDFALFWHVAGTGRTISLGTGLSRFADQTICSSGPIRLVRECPLQTASDRAIGHATGTVSLVCVLVLHKSIVENRQAQHKQHNLNRDSSVAPYRYPRPAQLPF
jgi:hypothetical protein